MKYRDEVEAKIAAINREPSWFALSKLIELGIRLGLEAAAQPLKAYSAVMGDEWVGQISEAIRTIQPADVMRKGNNDGE